jgi:glycosyltransferase involved in cell wall biosynthesis
MSDTISMSRNQNLYIVFPVLNEEVILEKTIVTTLKFCQENEIVDFELCIADNGSTDRTKEIGLALQQSFSKVSYVRLSQRGVGRALKATWSNCQADYVAFMDVDLSTNLKHLKEAYDLIQCERPLVIAGSRLKRGAKVEKRTLLREIISRCFNFWLSINLNVKFTDGMCGFKFVRKEFYDQLAKQFEFSDQWFFETELLVRAEWLGAQIIDIPVHWIDDPENSHSSSRLLSLIIEYLAGIERLRKEKKSFLKSRRKKYAVNS